MNIGQASCASGVSAKMIRYYEGIGLLPEAARKESGYRDYDVMDVHRLAFVRTRARSGFRCRSHPRAVASLERPGTGNVDVRAIANAHVAELQDQAKKLDAMIATLRHLVRSCRGENRDECSIMAI